MRWVLVMFTVLACGSCAPDVFLTGPETQRTPEETVSKEAQPSPKGPALAKGGVPPSARVEKGQQTLAPPAPRKAEGIIAYTRTEKTGQPLFSGKTRRLQEAPIPVKTEEARGDATPSRTQEVNPPAPSKTPISPSKKRKKTDQELLDSALEFCQASHDFWQQGDLENAIESLDQAYSLILKVDPGQNSDLLQQREDLRITISKRILEVYSSRYTVANGFYKAIPLAMNRHVRDALNLLKGK